MTRHFSHIGKASETSFLGSDVTVVLTKNDSGTMEELQQTHYYPSGGIIADLSSGRDVQNRLYNGKELDTSNNLWWYDYGARWMDASIGRWHSMDPLAERYYDVSPYVYCVNNPMKNIDPDGRKVKIVVGKTPVGQTSINLYSSSELKNGKISGEKTMKVPVYKVTVSNESGSSNDYYFTRTGYRKNYDNQKNPAVEVTFDVRKDGDTFPAVVKNRWGATNNVLELRNPDDISRQTVAGRKGNKDADRTAIQFHTKGATDGCLMSVGRNQIEEPSEEIRADLPGTSNGAQRAFMDDVMEYNKEDQCNNYSEGILVEFKQLYEK